MRFCGRPSELSPKAWLFSSLGLSPRPFDRHDWVVDRCGTEVRYVIDYYDGGNTPGTSHIYCDVRPAMDSVSGIVQRMRGIFASDD